MDQDKSNAQLEPAPATGATARRSGTGPLTIGRVVAVTAAASLVVGLLVGPMIASYRATGADPSATPEHTVTVTGIGEVSVAPDVADVVIGVSIQKPTVKEAQSAASTAMNATIAAVKKDGVADKDIITVDVSLNPVYDYGSGGSVPRLVGQSFSDTVKVTVHDLTKLGAVIDDSIAAGATMIQGVGFRLNDPKTVEAQARQLAMTDARTKADALASASGVQVKGVASIAEVTTSSPIVYGSGALDKTSTLSSTPIQTGTTDTQIQVTVSYLIG
jgi:uncharacterized protein YggE